MLRRLLVAVAGLTLVTVVNAPASRAVPHDPTIGPIWMPSISATYEGGRLVASPEDLLEDLGLLEPGGPAAPVDEAANWLLAAIGHDPIGADELATRLQLAPSDMIASLLALELAGVVERLPGGVFQRLKGP